MCCRADLSDVEKQSAQVPGLRRKFSELEEACKYWKCRAVPSQRYVPVDGYGFGLFLDEMALQVHCLFVAAKPAEL